MLPPCCPLADSHGRKAAMATAAQASPSRPAAIFDTGGVTGPGSSTRGEAAVRQLDEPQLSDNGAPTGGASDGETGGAVTVDITVSLPRQGSLSITVTVRASRSAHRQLGEGGWVMLDVCGNEFCVITPETPGFPDRTVEWPEQAILILDWLPTVPGY